MIYSAKSLVSPQFCSQYIDPTYIMDEDSLFLHGLRLVEEGNMYIQETIRMQIEVSRGSNIVWESFDVIDIIEKIITWFIDAIKTLFAKFKSWILRVCGSENYIKKNKDKILSFDGSFDVDFERYIYTCTDPDVPKCGLSDHFRFEFDRLETRLNELNGIKTREERIEIMNRIINDMENEITEVYYGNARGSCLGLSYPIAQDNYAKELFNIFRNGGEHYVGKVNKIEVAQVYERHVKVKDTIKDVEKARDEIVKSAIRVKKDIKAINLKNVSTDYIPYDITEEEGFDRIRKIKADQIQKMCSIYTMAFSAKIDALKDSISQDKRVLYEVITYLEVGE